MRFTVLLVVWLVSSAQSAAPARTSTDEAAVRDVVARYLASREQRDPAAVGALFVEDADQLTSSGEWRRGRAEVVRGTLASSDRTGGKRTITIETVRFPHPDVAIADGRYELTSDQDTRRMWTSFVMIKDGTNWRIAAIRNMLPAAPAAAR